MMKHLQKPGVQMALLFVVVVAGGVAYFLSKQAPPPVKVAAEDSKKGRNVGEMAVEEKKVETGDQRNARVQSEQVNRLVLPQEKPKPPTLLGPTPAQQKQAEKPPPLPKLVHIDRPASPKPFENPQPKFFAPRGLLIKAALVITVDSSSFDTPVLAMVTEDVYFQQRLIVPAGTQVIAKAGSGRQRDRIQISGNFTFIWADGREYNIPGIALDHVRESDGSYGITDGSAGIRGQIVQNDQYAQLKILVAEALQGIMNNNQTQFQSIYGLVPQNTSRNAALGGGSQAASAYSQMLTRQLEQDLDFVRVAAGTQFYIFTQAVFEPDLASVAGLKQGGRAASSWELAAETYARAQAEGARLRETAGEQAREAVREEVRATSADQVSRVRELLPSSSESGATPTNPPSNP